MSDRVDIELIEAVEFESVDRVRRLLAQGANANSRKRVSLTARVKEERLLRKGGLFYSDQYETIVDARTDAIECESVLGLAIMRGNEDIVRALLENGADPNMEIAWKISSWGKSWDVAKWNDRRWYWTSSFLCPLMLAMARGGTWSFSSGGGTGELPYSDGTIYANRKGGNVLLDNPRREEDSYATIRLNPNLEIVKILIQYHANVTTGVLATAKRHSNSQFSEILESHPSERQNFPSQQTPNWAIIPDLNLTSQPTRQFPQQLANQHVTKREGVPSTDPNNLSRPPWQIDYRSIIKGEKIGEGGFGVVFRAEWTAIDVAAKYLKLENGASREAYRTTFYQEVAAWHAVGYHPNVVPLLGASWEAPQPVMISKFMKNGNVLDYLAKCKANGTSVDKLRVLHNIAAGMFYLHSVRDIVHADLKPQNALVDDDGSTLVADFGTSKILDLPSEGITGNRAGTGIYMPPERLEGGGATKEGDVFAFGVTAYRIWTERIPYSELGLEELVTLRLIDKGQRPLIKESDEMPHELQRLVCQCWDADPLVRPGFELIARRLKDMRGFTKFADQLKPKSSPAAFSGVTSEFWTLLEESTNADQMDEEDAGAVQIINAVEQNDLSNLKRLVSKSANGASGANGDPNSRKLVTLNCHVDKDDARSDTIQAESALAVAILNGNVDAVRVLLDHGANPNAPIGWKLSHSGKWDLAYWADNRWHFQYKFSSALMMALGGAGCKVTLSNGHTREHPFSPWQQDAENQGLLRVNLKGGHVVLDTPQKTGDQYRDGRIASLVQGHLNRWPETRVACVGVEEVVPGWTKLQMLFSPVVEDVEDFQDRDREWKGDGGPDAQIADNQPHGARDASTGSTRPPLAPSRDTRWDIYRTSRHFDSDTHNHRTSATTTAHTQGNSRRFSLPFDPNLTPTSTSPTTSTSMSISSPSSSPTETNGDNLAGLFLNGPHTGQKPASETAAPIPLHLYLPQLPTGSHTLAPSRSYAALRAPTPKEAMALLPVSEAEEEHEESKFTLAHSGSGVASIGAGVPLQADQNHTNASPVPNSTPAPQAHVAQSSRPPQRSRASNFTQTQELKRSSRDPPPSSVAALASTLSRAGSLFRTKPSTVMTFHSKSPSSSTTTSTSTTTSSSSGSSQSLPRPIIRMNGSAGAVGMRKSVVVASATASASARSGGESAGRERARAESWDATAGPALARAQAPSRTQSQGHFRENVVESPVSTSLPLPGPFLFHKHPTPPPSPDAVARLVADQLRASEDLRSENTTLTTQISLLSATHASSTSHLHTRIAELEKEVDALRGVKDALKGTGGPHWVGKKDVKRVMWAAAEFVARDTDEMGMQMGDVVFVNVVYPDGWASGFHTSKNATGFFPFACVSPTKPSGDRPAVTVNKDAPRRTASAAVTVI
ncbi:hypothetical protein HDU93_001229 [Gonapodya sp. JEL0774]|nr:hypothetical protein HDU93_001229 [Gonapodya sp. JEL0774]